MNDYEYTFMQDVKEKKLAATGARHRATRGKKSFAVHNQSDYLTKKERDAMNGDVREYNLNEPMSNNQFQLLDRSSQKIYLEAIVEKYKINAVALSKMLGIHYSKAIPILKRFGLYTPRLKMSKEDRSEWEMFLNGRIVETVIETEVEDVFPEAATVSISGKDKETLLKTITTIANLTNGRHYKITLEVE